MITVLLKLLDGLRAILKTIEAQEDEGGQDGIAEDSELIACLEALQTPRNAESVACAPARERGGAAIAQGELRARKRKPVAHPKPRPAQAVVTAGTEAPTAHASAVIEVSTPGGDAGAASAVVVGPAAKAAVAAGDSAAESTLRVDVTLLNRMMNLVGELVLTRNQVLQATAADAKMTMLSRRLDMVTADLRESVMKARMQPVSNIFSKVPRMVRDLSQTLGRKVRLVMEGQDTELDKSLLEAIKDPLTHAVRNALDHGIEAPEVRAASAKNPEGVLKLRAVQEGSHVVVEIADDGAGIAVERVRDKAMERGLITPERAAEMSERELLQLIFLPGFSTAKQITNVSGRGVGMDVVRTNVEKIGGKVEVDSRVGRGTTLRLRIPLTLAIIPALIVRSAGQSFALPQGALSELVHVARDQAAKAIEWIEDAALYRLRGKLLPLVFLDRLLGGAPRPVDQVDNFIAVLDADGRRFGLIVDGLADPEEIVVKPLSQVLKSIGLYSGATVLGNGELALILDPGAIAVRAGITLHEEQLHEESGMVPEAHLAGRLEYLVVQVAGRQAAVPLEKVLRIEQVPSARIEYVGMRPVLNFSGQLLPLEDAGGLIDSASDHPEVSVIVVVCRQGGRQVGIAVEHVLDVARGEDLFQAGTTVRASGLKLLRDKVTGVLDLETVAPLPVAAAEEEALATSF